MAETNPLLEERVLPDFTAIRPDHVGPAIAAVLARYRACVDSLVADPAARSFATLLAPLEAEGDALARAWAPVDHLHSVADSKPLREVHAAALDAITEFEAELGQHRGLYEATRALRDAPGFAALGAAERAIVEDALRDFRLSGVALDEPARTRFRDIQTELSRLENEFQQAVLDATEAWTLDVPESSLDGLAASARELLRGNAAEAGVEGWRVNLRHPSFVAVMTYARDRELRRRVYEAYHTRASDQGPNAGRFDNGPRIEQILALRHEAARLLGFTDATEASLATKMAPSPQRVLEFLRELGVRARPVAQRELDELRAFGTARLALPDLQPWDVAYAAEQLREQRFGLNDEMLKPYFPAERAIEGVFAVAERLFGVRFAARDDVPAWHRDVRYYDVLDHQDRVFAGVYLDLYARQAKRSGAWMDVCRSRYRRGAALQHPVAFLTCNFAPPTASLPSLLTHDDVVTLFHEFGHGLHHLLTEVDWPSVSGISGVEWDAVELPSQLMENFAWERATLDLFARHWQTGEVLPEELYRKLAGTRHFHAGLFLVRQLEFGLFDFRVHREFDPQRGARVLELLEDARDEVAVLRPPAWHRGAHAFNHIFSGGYAAGYYSYLWAEVLSADAFERFSAAGILDRATGESLRREILAVGGSRPALESFVAFRGREPDPAALLRSYGLAA